MQKLNFFKGLILATTFSLTFWTVVLFVASGISKSNSKSVFQEEIKSSHLEQATAFHLFESL